MRHPDLKSMNRAGYAALAAACTLPVITVIGALRSGVDVFLMSLVGVGGLAFGYALIVIPDRKRAALADPTDLYRGSALLHARVLRRTDRFKDQFKKTRTWLLVTGDATGDLCVGEDGISWLPNANANRKKVPQVQIDWDQVKVVRIVPAPGTREPATVVVNLTDGTPVAFTINRYRELQRGLSKRNCVQWEVVRA